jgi:regulator of cell morphogenesis and NO signaling
LYEVRELYKELQGELNAHFIKEEKVLFPFIKAIVKAKRTGDFSELNNYPSVKEPVQMMEMEHEAAGEILREIRKATNDYALPEGACNSFGLLYKKLEALEKDLHQHIHLENNILFPKALQLEREINK